MDPQVIRQLPARLTPREREVLELMAQGRSNAAIAGRLVVTERAVAKHTANIFAELGLEVSHDDNRRVPAVVACLDQGRWNRTRALTRRPRSATPCTAGGVETRVPYELLINFRDG